MTPRFREHDLEALSREELEEERVLAIWRGTEARIAARARRRRDRRLALGIGSLVIVGAALGWVLADPGEARPQFLELAAGGVPGAVESHVSEALVELADGTRVMVSAGARWVPTDNRAAVFESEIERGRVQLDVRPGGSRRWRIRAGQTLVEVLGTRFTIEHGETRTTVRVERGRVAVQDARLSPPRVVLSAGESVVIDSEAPAHPVAPRSSDVAPVAPRPSAPRAARWRGLAARGEHHEAYRALGSRGLREIARSADAEQLMLLADVARLSGHPADAVPPLSRLIGELPTDPRAPIAAVLLGRIYMDDLEEPLSARRALERALDLGLSGPLRPDVERRLRRLAAEPR